MTIYHYTTIQTLALILKHKTIRFNRLDRVDDMEESAYGSGPTKSMLSQYCFVSCWTKSDEENLALWNMYTRYKGVRIGIDEMPFVTYQVNDHFWSFFKEPMGFGIDYSYSSFLNEAKLYDIEYVDNPEEKISELAQRVGETGMVIQTPNIGTYKRKEWAMQKESRFKLYVQPIDVNYALRNANTKDNGFDAMFKLVESMGPSIAQSKPIKKTYVDMPLKPEKLENIEIMMGPLTSEADRIIVEALLMPYPNATVKDSAFLGKMRERV